MQKNMVSLADLFSQTGMQMRVDVLHIHPCFHTDEGAGYWIATSESFRNRMEEKFPGIREAQVQTWGAGQTIPVNDQANERSFGCRGGSEDEHTLRGKQFQQTCSAAIFAKNAGLSDDAVLMAMLDRITKEDRKGSKEKAIHQILKWIHRMMNPPELPEILAWVCLVYEAQYQTYRKNPTALLLDEMLTLDVGFEMIADIFGKEKAQKWVDLGRRAVRNHEERAARMLVKLSDDMSKGEKSEFWSSFTYGRLIKDAQGDLINIRDEQHKIVVIETKSMEVQKPAMKLGASLVVIKSLEGRITILGDKHKRIDLSLVALALRQEELDIMRENGDPSVKSFDPRALTVCGHVTGWPVFRPTWHLHDVDRPDKDQLYCGSEAAPLVPSSQIPLDRIVKILKLVLARQFHPHFYEGCRNGKCVGGKCPWYGWKLVQCGIAQGKVKLAQEMQPA